MVEEPALADLDVEQPPDTGGPEDALRGPADLAGVGEPTGADPLLQREQLGLGAGHQLGGAGGVARLPFGHGGDHNSAVPSARRDLAGCGCWRGDRDPRRRHRVGQASRASAQVGSRCSLVARTWSNPCPPTTSTLSAEIRPRSATTHDPAHPEPVGQVVQHVGQGGDIGGVAGEHVMGDRDPVPGAQQADHDLRPVRAVVTGVAERPGREPVRRAAVDPSK